MKQSTVFWGLLGLILIVGGITYTLNMRSEHNAHTAMPEMTHHTNSASHHIHQHANSKEAGLIEQLQRGGYILYARHERTELERTHDEEPLRFAECNTQRNLSLAGRASANEIGQAIKLLGIKISKSYTSPFCRTVETAMGMFGSAENIVPLSGRALHTDAFDMEKAGLLTKEFLLGLQPETGSNIAVTGHWGTFNAALGIPLHEGDIAVLTNSNGKLEYHGTIHPATWSDVIHDMERAKMH